MGSNVQIQIGLDYLHEIEENPKEFVSRLVSAIKKGEPNSLFGGYVKVERVAHADEPRLFFAYRNSFYEIHEWNAEKQQSVWNKGIFEHAYKGSLKIIKDIVNGYTKKMKEIEKKINEREEKIK